MKAKGREEKELKGLGIPGRPMCCSRCRVVGSSLIEDENMTNGWMYAHWFTAAKRWHAAFLCPTCASLFELWMEEA